MPSSTWRNEALIGGRLRAAPCGFVAVSSVALAVAVTSCAVPEVVFTNPDAEPDERATDAPSTDSRGIDGPVDASAGSGDASEQCDAGEGGTEAGTPNCPNVVPAGATWCCGSVPCVRAERGQVHQGMRHVRASLRCVRPHVLPRSERIVQWVRIVACHVSLRPRPLGSRLPR